MVLFLYNFGYCGNKMILNYLSWTGEAFYENVHVSLLCHLRITEMRVGIIYMRNTLAGILR